MGKLMNLLKKRAAEALIAALLLLLSGIYVHALRQQNGMNDRLRQTEIDCSANGASISSFLKALDDRTETMRRELEQRTGEMQQQLTSATGGFKSEVESLERLINTLIVVLKDNGVAILHDKEEL